MHKSCQIITQLALAKHRLSIISQKNIRETNTKRAREKDQWQAGYLHSNNRLAGLLGVLAYKLRTTERKRSNHTEHSRGETEWANEWERERENHSQCEWERENDNPQQCQALSVRQVSERIVVCSRPHKSTPLSLSLSLPPINCQSEMRERDSGALG